MKGERVKNDTIKTVILFSVVAFVFCGLVVGGIHFIKSRNSSYAATQAASTDGTKQTNPESKTGDNSTSQTQPKTEESPQPVVASSPAPTPPVKADNAPVVSPDTIVETGPQSMPATGAGLGDFIFTIALMMVAAFFGGQLLRAKNNYRRLYDTNQ